MQKFEGERHIPGINFAGRGTKLEFRFNSNNTAEEWSKPVDRTIGAAYHHHLAYAAHSGNANRNVADRIMLQEPDLIDNTNLSEKIERDLVRIVINAKQRFCLGRRD